MANTARNSTTIIAYGQISAAGHDPTKDQARISGQEWRDTMVSLAQYASAVWDSTLTHATTGSTDVYTVTGFSTTYPAISSSDIAVSSTAGTFTMGTAGTYLIGFEGDFQGDGDFTFNLVETSTAGSTNQGGHCLVHTLSTAQQHSGFSQMVNVAAGNSVSVTYSATTAASTFLINGSFWTRRVK